jgi:hypothetical protein
MSFGPIIRETTFTNFLVKNRFTENYLWIRKLKNQFVEEAANAGHAHGGNTAYMES